MKVNVKRYLMKKKMMKEKVIHPKRVLLGFPMQLTQIKKNENYFKLMQYKKKVAEMDSN